MSKKRHQQKTVAPMPKSVGTWRDSMFQYFWIPAKKLAKLIFSYNKWGKGFIGVIFTVFLFGWFDDGSWENKISIGGSFLIYFVWSWLSMWRQKVESISEIKKLKEEAEGKIKFYQDEMLSKGRENLNNYLQKFSRKSKLKFDTQERISIYCFLSNENCFECVSRFSKHPDYNQLSPHRKNKYPKNEGIIGKVWDDGKLDGFCRDDKIPVRHLKGKDNNIKNYQEYHKKNHGVPKSISKKFRMKSVDIIAMLIYDTKKKPTAVIVFESQQKEFMEPQKIRSAWKLEKFAIASFLDLLKLPDQSTRKEM